MPVDRRCAISRYLEVVPADAAELAAAVRAAPAAPVACYEGWTLVDLGAHVGQIHRWVTGIVERGATARPAGGHVDPPGLADLPDWITAGARHLVEALAAAPSGDEVWTISSTHRDVGFWRRRMALETALHRWDADDALGREATVPAWLALEGVEETLHVYLEQRLDGRDVGGSGQRVAFVPEGAPDGWTMTLLPAGVEVTAGSRGADAVVRGRALDLWLLLTCRVGLQDLDVEGDAAAATLATRAARMVPGPAG